MAARAIASVTLSFGLVAIPVKIYGAISSVNPVAFNLLTKSGSRVKQQYVSAADGSVVDRADLQKGYEFAKDQYISFSPDEIKALDEMNTKSIEVGEFVPYASVDPTYFDNTYYLVPDVAGAKPYALFAQALRETGRVGIGRWVNRGRDHVVMVRPIGDTLAIQLLHFNSEVRGVDSVQIPAPKQAIKPAELGLAKQLIEQQAASAYNPAAYTDEHTARVQAAIQAKVEGKPITADAPATEPVVPDLMAALAASLAATKA